MRQITREESVKIYESKLYEDWSNEQIVKFQLFQSKLAMPFAIFHEAIEDVLGRSVLIHEFGMDVAGLKKEFLKEKDPPTLEEIIALIPEGKRFVIDFSDTPQQSPSQN